MSAVAAASLIGTLGPLLQEADTFSKQIGPLVDKYKTVVDNLSKEAEEVVTATINAEDQVIGAVEKLTKINELKSGIEMKQAEEEVLKHADIDNPYSTASELKSMGTNYVDKTASSNILYNSNSNSNLNDIPVYRGGKKFSLKQIQKGGRLAAKRTKKSINTFLNTGVTSSYIYDMVTKKGGKRKQKSKRKRSNSNKRSVKRVR